MGGPAVPGTAGPALHRCSARELPADSHLARVSCSPPRLFRPPPIRERPRFFGAGNPCLRARKCFPDQLRGEGTRLHEGPPRDSLPRSDAVELSIEAPPTAQGDAPDREKSGWGRPRKTAGEIPACLELPFSHLCEALRLALDFMRLPTDERGARPLSDPCGITVSQAPLLPMDALYVAPRGSGTALRRLPGTRGWTEAIEEVSSF